MAVITAKFSSQCPACGGRIEAGSRVNWERGSRATHETCGGGVAVAERPAEPAREWSAMQQAIFAATLNGTGNILVEAGPGCAKTTSSVEDAKRVKAAKPNASIVMCAFNASIAGELKQRVPQGVEAATFHSIWFRALSQHLGTRVSPDRNKVRKLATAMVRDGQLDRITVDLYLAGAVRLVAAAKSAGIGVCIPNTPESWAELQDQYDIEFDGPSALDGVKLAERLLEANTECLETIDFDDMLYLSAIFGVQCQRYDYVFVDESQDFTPLQLHLLHRMLADDGKLIAVGDKNQCQPEGTVVMLEGGRECRIEDLTIGTRVVSYNRHPGNSSDAHFTGLETPGRRITDMCKRAYEGELIRVEVGTHINRYTPQHKNPVRFSPITDDWYAVYLMVKGTTGRIGCSQMWYSTAKSGPVFGPAMRARHEKADAVWILSAHPTRRAALNAERIIAGKYGMLLQTFQHPGNLDTDITQQDINLIIEGIGDNMERVSAVLSAHGRDIEYPLWSKENNTHFSTVYTFITQSCNLISDVMEMGVFDGTPHASWQPITVSREHFAGFVYSLEVETHHLYVGNGVLTSNSIYAFRGAASNSMDQIRESFDCAVMPLNTSYRCAKAIVREAQAIAGPESIEAGPNNPEGVVEHHGAWSLDLLSPTDAVLCRNTAPLVRLAYRCIAARIPVRMTGREIGDGLVSLIRKLKPVDIDDLQERLSEYGRMEIARLTKRLEEEKAAALQDKIDSINTAISNLTGERTIEALIMEIEEIFEPKPEGMLTLSTVHRAKGSEYPNVWILDAHLMPSRYARTPEQIQQERNVQFVAVTRAQKELHYIDSGLLT